MDTRLKYLQYIEESQKNNVAFYDDLNEAIDTTGWNYTNVYDINSPDSQKELNSITIDNFKDKFNSLIWMSFNNKCYGNPYGNIPIGSGVNIDKAKEIRKYFLTNLSVIKDSSYAENATSLSSIIPSIKEITSKQKVKLSTEEIYKRLVNKDYSGFPKELASILASNITDIIVIRETYEKKYSSYVSQAPSYIVDTATKKISSVAIKNFIPTYKEEPTISKFFGRIFADCIFYLFANAIANKSEGDDKSKTPEEKTTDVVKTDSVKTAGVKKVRRSTPNTQSVKKLSTSDAEAKLRAMGY